MRRVRFVALVVLLAGAAACMPAPPVEVPPTIAPVIDTPPPTAAPTTSTSTTSSTTSSTSTSTTTSTTTTTLPEGVALTSLRFDSDPGDFLGAGVQRTWTPDDGTFTLSGDAAAVQIAFKAPGTGGTTWNLKFAAPTKLPSPRNLLRVGTYATVTRAASPTGPGLDISGSGRGCSVVSGRFVVRQAELATNAALARFAADFELHCEGATPALRGTILYNALAPFPSVADTDADGVPDITDVCTNVPDPAQADADRDAIGDACDATQESFEISVDAPAGEPLTGGMSRTWYRSDGAFTSDVGSGGDPRRVTVSLDTAGVDWKLDFAPRSTAAAMLVGPYDRAEPVVAHSAGRPGMSISVGNSTCTPASARFDIRQIVLNPDGTLARFAADFEQVCSGSAVGLHGTVRYDASTPFPPIPDADADGVADTVDLCPNVADPGQADADRDLLGDACDPAFENVSLRTDSELGDFVGGGLLSTSFREDGVFTATASSLNTIKVRLDSAAPDWTLNFKPPSGSTLTAGTTYSDVVRYTGANTTAAGLSVTGNGHGCNSLTGQFTINELVYNPNGTVARFSADFEQHCDGAVAALRGSVRYFSTAA